MGQIIEPTVEKQLGGSTIQADDQHFFVIAPQRGSPFVGDDSKDDGFPIS
jgi:hypothetical protein